tara:strand:+ start:80 stop:292 length:213 start_codon:yes stop_codon:yes gene_type:complete
MASLSHCSWLTRLLIAMLKSRPEIIELEITTPAPLFDDDHDEPLAPEDFITVQFLRNCWAMDCADVRDEH